MAARVAPQGLPPLAEDEGADLAQRAVPADRLPGPPLLRRAQAEDRAQEPRRGRPRAAQDLRAPRHPAQGAGDAGRAWRSTRCSTACRWPPPSRASCKEMGIIFCSFSEAVHQHPELVKKYLGSVVPPGDNFYAALNAAVFTDGSFVYIPKGVRCPMELSTYFRINAMNTGQFERTLIIADAGATVSYLEGCTAPMRDENQLHAAVVELVRARRGDHQVFDGAELVPGRQERQGRDLQLRHQARPVRRPQVEDLLDPGRDRLGDHLEIPELHPEGRRLGGRVLLGGGDQQLPAGRHRHQDDPHGQAHLEHHRLQGHLGRPRPEHLPRPGEDPRRARRTPATTPSATRC